MDIQSARDWLSRLVVTAKHWLMLQMAKALLRDSVIARPEIDDLLRSASVRLSQAGSRCFTEREHFRAEEGVKLMEQAWALSKEPDTACQLGLMYERMNRNSDAVLTYREAFRRHPLHAELRCQSAIQLLRHGKAPEIREFLEAMASVDPGDIFSAFMSAAFDNLSPWVQQIVHAVNCQASEHQPLLLAFAVWDKAFAVDFMHNACSALVATGNIPAAAERFSIHIVILTTGEGMEEVRSHPLYEKLAVCSSVHFLGLPAIWTDYAQAMISHYGDRLGARYAVNCSFLIFSSVYSVCLEAGRQVGALVMPPGANSVVNDGALHDIASIVNWASGNCDHRELSIDPR